MMPEKDPSTEDSKKYRRIGGMLTFGWLSTVFIYVIASGHSIFGLEPNELGDFLAGILGPVGILWLILGFWQQGDELRSCVRALELQSEELRNSVEQQRALVEVTRQQAKAEIDALHEEREARRLASSPKLVLSSLGGSSIGPGRFSAALELRNLGADCSDLKILDLSTDGFPSVVNTISTLGYRESAKFHLNHGEPDHLGFELMITYQTRFGELGEISFWLSRVKPQSIGVSIEPYDN